MKKTLQIGIGLIIIGVIVLGIGMVNNALCPNGNDDSTRWGCGYSMVELNQMNCQKIGGTYMYGGAFSAGNCVK